MHVDILGIRDHQEEIFEWIAFFFRMIVQDMASNPEVSSEMLALHDSLHRSSTAILAAFESYRPSDETFSYSTEFSQSIVMYWLRLASAGVVDDKVVSLTSVIPQDDFFPRIVGPYFGGHITEFLLDIVLFAAQRPRSIGSRDELHQVLHVLFRLSSSADDIAQSFLAKGSGPTIVFVLRRFLYSKECRFTTPCSSPSQRYGGISCMFGASIEFFEDAFNVGGSVQVLRILQSNLLPALLKLIAFIDRICANWKNLDKSCAQLLSLITSYVAHAPILAYLVRFLPSITKANVPESLSGAAWSTLADTVQRFYQIQSRNACGRSRYCPHHHVSLPRQHWIDIDASAEPMSSGFQKGKTVWWMQSRDLLFYRVCKASLGYP
jgi:hypothetical protein